MTKFMFEICVPCEMNGKPVRTRHHRNWDEYVYKIAGGVTILKPGKGKWISPTKKLHEERVIPVRVGCTEAEMKKIAAFTIKHYNQEAVLYYKLGEMILVYR